MSNETRALVKAIKRSDGKFGWTLDYSTVKAISDATRDADWVGMEGVEAVMLAMADRGYAAIEAQGSDHE